MLAASGQRDAEQADHAAHPVYQTEWWYYTGHLRTTTGKQVGRDWFSIQLANHYEVILYHIRHQDGSIDPYSSGTLVRPDGSSLHLRREDFQIVDEQELITDNSTRVTYWEGSVQIRGSIQGQAIEGEGYVEMTGYVQRVNV